jgi:DNA replication factor GINS
MAQLPDSLSYDEIHAVLTRERSSRSLGKIPHDFYERLALYLADARAGLDEESLKGPSPRLVLLQGQFRNLEEMARDILLLRLRKAAEATFTVLEGGVLNERALPPEEVAFSQEFLEVLKRTRGQIIREGGAPLRPEKAALAPRPSPAPSPVPPARESAAQAPPAKEAAPPAPERQVVLLRILDDVAPFEGDDNRVYRLKREDLVTLPRELAQILLRRKKAVELEVPA